MFSGFDSGLEGTNGTLLDLPGFIIIIIITETVGIAMILAAAVAAAQQPKIQELESEVAKARASLETSKED
jgi:hypothetical protein